MSLIVEINPKGIDEFFLQSINGGFPGWGNMPKYEWTYKRGVGLTTSDIIIIKDEKGEILAGSGTSYRPIVTPSGEMVRIGIMTGSWTLPAARRKGCFTKIIEVSEELAHWKNADYLCGFLAGNNPSYGRLNAASRVMKPTSYMFSPTSMYDKCTSGTLQVIGDIDKDLLERIYIKNNESVKGYTHFKYTLEEFEKQYISRPGNIDVIEFSDSNIAIVEETHDVIKVQLLTWNDIESFISNIKCLTNWGLKERGKKLMYFTSLLEIKESCSQLNFDIVDGYFHIIINDRSKKETMDDHIQRTFSDFKSCTADRM